MEIQIVHASLVETFSVIFLLLYWSTLASTPPDRAQ